MMRSFDFSPQFVSVLDSFDIVEKLCDQNIPNFVFNVLVGDSVLLGHMLLIFVLESDAVVAFAVVVVQQFLACQQFFPLFDTHAFNQSTQFDSFKLLAVSDCLSFGQLLLEVYLHDGRFDFVTGCHQ
jgi:hypothetical protein